MKHFVDSYLDRQAVPMDVVTKKPLEPVSLTFFINTDGTIQYHAARMFLVPEYTDYAVGKLIRIYPMERGFGYFIVKHPMSVLDIHNKLEEMGLKSELVKASDIA